MNYFLLLQQLFQIVVVFFVGLFSWAHCFMQFLSLLCSLVICSETHNAISIVSYTHSALWLFIKPLCMNLKKKKKRRKKINHPKLEVAYTLQFPPFPLNVWKPDSTKEMVYEQTSHTRYILFAVNQFCHKRQQVFTVAWTSFSITKTSVSFSLKP